MNDVFEQEFLNDIFNKPLKDDVLSVVLNENTKFLRECVLNVVKHRDLVLWDRILEEAVKPVSTLLAKTTFMTSQDQVNVMLCTKKIQCIDNVFIAFTTEFWEEGLAIVQQKEWFDQIKTNLFKGACVHLNEKMFVSLIDCFQPAELIDCIKGVAIGDHTQGKHLLRTLIAKVGEDTAMKYIQDLRSDPMSQFVYNNQYINIVCERVVEEVEYIQVCRLQENLTNAIQIERYPQQAKKKM